MDTPLTKVPSYGVTNDEIMDFLKDKMVTKEELGQKLEAQDQKFDQKIGKLKHDLMDYTDTRMEKLRFDIQGDIVTQSRKEDAKLITLIEILKNNRIISEQDASALLRMEPFPRLRE